MAQEKECWPGNPDIRCGDSTGDYGKRFPASSKRLSRVEVDIAGLP